jgi:formamidopyrimidine-DNA glycosylase
MEVKKMPELPEVETVKENLKKRLINTKINDVKVLYNNIIAYPDTNTFEKTLKNKKVKDITRRGKFIIFDLEDYYLLSHLRMEGKYFIKNKNDQINKHEHVIFNLDNNQELRYMDTRKFGKMFLIQKENIDTIGPLKELGLEPFDKKLTPNYLKEKIKNKIIPIKTALLDQSIIAGIGNIYADEILFLAHVNPLKKSNTLKEKELNNIIKSTKEVLNKAIAKGGTTIHTYTSVDGIKGTYQDSLFVHNKEKELCKVCQTQIKKIKVGGRGTYYCPHCQK